MLIAKTSELLKDDYDWTRRGRAAARRRPCSSSPTPTPCARRTSSSSTALLGGGLRDAGWDGSLRPTARLAILPGTTHYDIYASPALAPAVVAFLDADAALAVGQRQHRRHDRPPSRRADERQRPAGRLGAVAQAEDAGAARRVGAAAPVVGDLAAQDGAVAADRDARAWPAAACLATLVSASETM